MLEQIKQLELVGDWAELKRLAETIPAGDALARVHLALSLHYESIAADAAGYRVALAHGRKALAAAIPGGLMHVWSLARVATYSADLGMYRAAEQTACAFLTAIPDHPKAEAIAPWARFALGRVRANQRRFPEAIALYREAIAASTGAFAERIQLAIVWAYAQAGKVTKAVQECPGRVDPSLKGHLHAATAIILAKAGDWQGARTAAKTALPFYSGSAFLPSDVVEAAELLLILRAAARHLGQPDLVAVWFEHIAANLAGGLDDLLNGLLPTLPREGGALFGEAASRSRGLPDGYHRCGLLGACG